MFRSTYSFLLAALCLCIPALATSQTVEYISHGSTFKYVNTQQSTSADALGIDTTDFTQPGYDDSAWLTGAAPFGNVSSGDFGYNTYWQENFDPLLRKSITLANPVTMTVNLGADNGFGFYVNGALITGANAEGYTNRWEYTFSVDASHFVAGNNVIALALEDHGGLTAFDMQMLGPPSTNVPEPGACTVLAIGIVNTFWLLRRRKMRR